VPERITASKLAEMRELYLEHRSIQKVVDLAHVDWHTADKYRVEDEWDKACVRVDKLAEDLAVKKIGKRRADNIRIAQAAIVKMAKSLNEAGEAIPFNARGLNLLARLVEFLSGEPDSRPAGTGEYKPVVILPDDGSDPDFKPVEPIAGRPIPGTVDPAVEVSGEPR